MVSSRAGWAVAALLLVACGSSYSYRSRGYGARRGGPPGDGQGGQGGFATAPAGAGGEASCGDLVGRAFVSEALLPGGNSPAGPVMGRWRITFGPGDYTFQYSDVSERGTYECESGVLAAVGPGAVTRNGRFDPAAQRLVWEAQPFVPEDRAAPPAPPPPSRPSRRSPPPAPVPAPIPAPPAPPDSRSSSVPALAQSAQEARACQTAQDCVVTCKVDGDCCGTYCGCSNALNRDFLARLTAHQAQVCNKQYSCLAVGCAMRGPFFPVCNNGLCEARTMDQGL